MTKAKTVNSGLTNTQVAVLVIMRMVIGWHLLYEGVSKLLIPKWSAAAYLLNSRWLFADVFHWMATHATVLKIVDFLNIWGLILIGLALLVGIFTRFASLMGIGLLTLYYIANPPFIGIDFGIPTEGHYLFVNKTLVEIMALAVLVVFPMNFLPGLDKILLFLKEKFKSKQPQTAATANPGHTVQNTDLNRRDLIKSLASVPLIGAFAYGSAEKYQWEKFNAITGATIKVSDTQLKDLKGELPRGEIKGHSISRLFMGGNLIGGWSHSRDLIYVSSLFKAYNTEKKVFETLQLGEKAGINAINITGIQFPIINKYKRIFNSQLKTICQVHPTKEDPYGTIDHAIDNGVDLVQIQGNCCDWRVQAGEIDVLVKAIDHIKKQGYPAGLGAHSVQALLACEKAGIEPDFYMKTLHHDQYWSAHPRGNRIPFSVDGKRSADHNEFHDNMFCLFPEETAAFINRQKVPVIGFKVLAGGAIKPEDGFKFAFEKGADFICVGMFDYQIVDDVNVCVDVLKNLEQRQRERLV